MRSTDISKELQGEYESPLVNSLDYKEIISSANVADVEDFIDEVSFESCLNGSIFCYNHIKSEIIVSNPNYSYSFIYSLLSKYYYKAGWEIANTIKYYPTMLVDSNGTLYVISEEDWTDNSPALIESYPVKQTSDVFKNLILNNSIFF